MDINEPQLKMSRAVLAEHCGRIKSPAEALRDYVEGLEILGVELTFSEKDMVRRFTEQATFEPHNTSNTLTLP